MIYREEDRLLWKRKNTLPIRGNYYQGDYVCLHGDEDSVLLINGVGVKIRFTRDQFYEMSQAGAAHFGDQVQVSPLPILCPLCGGKSEIVIHKNFNNASYIRRQCKLCGLSGPVSPTEEAANKQFSRLSLRGSNADEAIPGDHP